MISAWWLLAIIPISVTFGWFIAALCHAASRRDEFDS